MVEENLLVFGGIAVIGIVAGFIHSAIGFGFGIVAISLLPFIIDGRSAHIVVSISSLPMLMMAVWTYRRGAEKRSLIQALLGAALLLPPGLWLFETISLDLLIRATGLGVLIMVLLSLRTAKSSAEKPSRWGDCFAAGAISGFLAGAVSIAGPPIAAFALKQDWSPARYKAFISQCMLAMATYKAVLLIGRDHVDESVTWQILVASVTAMSGVFVGAWASRDIPAQRFKSLVAVSLMVVSCVMMWRGQSPATGQENVSDAVVSTPAASVSSKVKIAEVQE